MKKMNSPTKQVRFNVPETLDGKLCTAIQMRQYERVKQLLQCGARPNELVNETTAMHWAAGQDDSTMSLEAMKLLLKFGGDPNISLSAGTSPVHIAASWGYTNMLKLLVERGGDPWREDGDGCNAWDLALSKCHWDVLRYLASYMEDGDLNPPKKENITITFTGSRDLSVLDNTFIYHSSSSASVLNQTSLNDESFMNNAAFMSSALLESTIASVQVEEYLYKDDDFGVNLSEIRFPPLVSEDCLLNNAICSNEDDDEDSETSMDSEELIKNLKSHRFTLSESKYPDELLELLETSIKFSKINHPSVRLDRVFNSSFRLPNPGKALRDGCLRKSFNYLLLDPRLMSSNSFVSQNASDLPDLFRNFLSAVFYIGKGKQTRPFEHLYEAMKSRNKASSSITVSSKTKKILEIWTSGQGVISLQVFQNSLPAEAFSREAAMIDAIGLSNLSNVKRGSYYGICTAWSLTEKRQWGSYLLAKAFRIFLHEGERQIFPSNL